MIFYTFGMEGREIKLLPVNIDARKTASGDTGTAVNGEHLCH